MTKHSKNNTASSIFSYAEYKKLDYGTKRVCFTVGAAKHGAYPNQQRLGNESMRRFDACALCLNRAREPVACGEGHLFCKECVYTDLLTQKKDIQTQKKKLEALTQEVEEEKVRAKEAARERVLRDFEKGQLGLSAFPSATGTKSGADEPRGTKRKFAFDSSTVENLAREAEEAALREIEREQADALKNKLPDFWLPSLTPTYTSTGPPTSLKDVKLQTTCRGGNPSHPIALKHLIPVKFSYHDPNSGPSRSMASTPAESEEKTRKEDSEPMCPSCKKHLSNNILMFVMKPCAHVTCKTCTDSLVRPAKQCIVCDKVLKEKDIVELKREGTGFAGGGLAETSKTGTAFQG
ncbi:Nitric oxide synthase-interacting like protein [Termitomyces sp. J132]|nr:Nitric oxide synthase-interacting like protein [Termitomyces sp. J132]